MSAGGGRPRALLLDLDDTLLDNSVIPGFIRRTCELVAEAYPTFGAVELLDANTKAWAEYWPEVERQCWLGGLDVATVSREGGVERSTHAAPTMRRSSSSRSNDPSSSIARRAGRSRMLPICCAVPKCSTSDSGS